MSFEGFYQIICENGHYDTEDCFVFDINNNCKICNGKIIWWNLVDYTNGSHDEDGKRIDGFVKLCCTNVQECTCPTCGHVNNDNLKFKIPKNVGHLIE